MQKNNNLEAQVELSNDKTYRNVKHLPPEKQRELAFEMYEMFDDIKRIVIPINTCFDAVYSFLDGLTDATKCNHLYGDGSQNPENKTKEERLKQLTAILENCGQDKAHWGDVWEHLTDLHISAELRDVCVLNLMEQVDKISKIDRAVVKLIVKYCDDSEKRLVMEALKKNRAGGKWIFHIKNPKAQSAAKRELKKYAIIRAKNVKDCERLLVKASRVEKLMTKAKEISDILITTNLNLVTKQVAMKSPTTEHFVDYIHEGVLGMIRATRRYNPYNEKGTNYHTYVYYQICESVSSYHVKTSNLITPQAGVIRSLAELNKQTVKHKDSKTDKSRMEYLEVKLNMSKEEINKIYTYDVGVITGAHQALEQATDDYNALPDELYERDFNQKKVKELYHEQLTETERTIFDCRMSGKIREPLAYRNFKEATNVQFSHERIRQIEGNIFEKIKKAIEGDDEGVDE